MNIISNLQLSIYHKKRHAGYHTIKLKQLKDKQARYETHYRCLESEIVKKMHCALSGTINGLPCTGKPKKLVES